MSIDDIRTGERTERNTPPWHANGLNMKIELKSVVIAAASTGQTNGSKTSMIPSLKSDRAGVQQSLSHDTDWEDVPASSGMPSQHNCDPRNHVIAQPSRCLVASDNLNHTARRTNPIADEDHKFQHRNELVVAGLPGVVNRPGQFQETAGGSGCAGALWYVSRCLWKCVPTRTKC